MSKMMMHIFGFLIYSIIIAILGIIISAILTKVARIIESKKQKKYILDKYVPEDDMKKIRVKLSSYLNIELPVCGGIDSKFIHAMELFDVRTLEIKKEEPHIYDLIVRDIFGEYRHKFNI